MIQLRFTKRGGLVLAIWTAVLAYLLALVLFVIFSFGWWVWTAASGLALLALLGLPWRAAKGKLTFSKQELRIRRGYFFRSVRRIPLRFVTGYTLFATPLQRILRICCVLLHTSGAFVLILGITRANAELLCSEIEDTL